MSGVTQYVLGLVRRRAWRGDDIILVCKRKPDWQRGLLNVPGGKVEPGESPIAAMRREWREEIGFGFDDWRYVALILGDGFAVNVFAGAVLDFPAAMPVENDAGEAILTVKRGEIVCRRDVVPNLKWLIPLAFDDPARPVAKIKYCGDPIPSFLDEAVPDLSAFNEVTA